MKNRARRRHHRARMVAKAALVLRLRGDRRNDRQARKLADNLAQCSCQLCHYEKHYGIPTVSDLRRQHAAEDTYAE